MTLLPENAAKVTHDFCQATDRETEKIITDKLRELAEMLCRQQRLVLEKVGAYRVQLAGNEAPSAEEFYDLFELVHDDNYYCKQMHASYFDGDMYRDWAQYRKDAPNLPMRRHLMLAVLDEYLENCVYSGLGRLSQSVARTGGNDLFAGEHILPAREEPAHLSLMIDGRWRLADVVLPRHMSWYERPRGNLCDVPSFVGLPTNVRDMMIGDIVMPKGSSAQQKLHTRLQKLPGVGAKAARLVRQWLEEIGCTIDP